MANLTLWPWKSDSHSETSVSQYYKVNYLLNVFACDCNYIDPVK